MNAHVPIFLYSIFTPHQILVEIMHHQNYQHLNILDFKQKVHHFNPIISNWFIQVIINH